VFGHPPKLNRAEGASRLAYRLERRFASVSVVIRPQVDHTCHPANVSNGLPPTRVQRVGEDVIKQRAWEHERSMMAAADEAGWAPPFTLIGRD